MTIRPAEIADSQAIADIYNEGVAGRTATFVIEPVDSELVRAWLGRRGPVLVAEDEHGVAAFASVSEYSEVPAYWDVGEFGIYVATRARGRGLGTRLLQALCAAAEEDGRFKLLGKVFADNDASLALCRRCGFSEVGVHRRHGRLDGRWRDVLVVERLLGAAAEEED